MPVHRLPERFRALAWQTFFASRRRGISLEAHFPWLADADGRTVAIVARVADAAAAMLVVRNGRLKVEGTSCAIAAIGLVCTDPTWRGRGLASTLIEAALAEGSTRADVALLWTRQAAFYERLGFRTADPMSTGIARLATSSLSHSAVEGRFADSALATSAIFAGRRGVPPFIEQVRVFATGDDTVAIGEAAAGGPPVLLGWEGDPDRILQLVAEVAPPAIRWNGTDCDALTAAAIRAGHTLDLAPVELAMWRPLTDRTPSIAALARTPIPLLDRF